MRRLSDKGKNRYILKQQKKFFHYVCVLAGSGLCDREARNLRWQDYRWDVEDDGQEFVYLQVTGKTDAREVLEMPYIKIHLEALQSRDEFSDDDDYIFVNKNGEKLTNQNKTFADILKRVGLHKDAHGRYRSLTSLRHYYATTRLKEGEVDVFRLAENMGNKVEQIKNHYAEVNPYVFRRHLTKRK